MNSQRVGMPLKRSGSYNEQPIRIYYGINPRTLTVEKFWLSRERRLSGVHEGSPVAHVIHPPLNAASELKTVYGLTDIVELPMISNLWENDKVRSLQQKAAALRNEYTVSADLPFVRR